MPSVCAVVGCGSRSDRDFTRSFFRIPKVKGREDILKLTTERRRKWIASLRRADLTETRIKYARICDKHFISGRPADLFDEQNPDWIPSRLMGYNLPMKKNRRGKIPIKEFISPQVPSDDEEIPEDDESTSATGDYDVSPSNLLEVEFIVDKSSNRVNLTVEQCCVGTQTDLTMEDITKMSDVTNYQKRDIEKLKEKLRAHIVNENTFNKDNEKTKFYTGVETFETLMTIFNLISIDLADTSSITRFQQLVLTLKRLRLNLSLTDLAYRYEMRLSIATEVFENCLYELYRKLKKGVVWPDREMLRKTMPSDFSETFGEKLPVIIDCVEIKMEKPSNSSSSNQAWFNNEQHHTSKFLLGFCLQGAIMFISEEYDGRTSDKELALNCGILERLHPGDIVLTNWGFLVCDGGRQSNVPCSTRGTKHLLPYVMEESGRISDIRIQMEKVTSNLKKYQILQSVLPNHVPTLTFEDAPSLVTQIVYVCCALNNTCISII